MIAIIPARGDSKGVPKKNIKPLGGYPLIAFSIVAALLSAKIERVIVSTDSREIADIAHKYGAEVPFLRPTEFARDESPDKDFITHAIKWFTKNESSVPDYFVHLRPTTPLRDPKVIDSAASEIINKSAATSLRSAHPASESPYKWFVCNEQGYFTSINPDYSNDYINEPRQSFPKVYIPNGYVDILKTSFINTSGLMHGDMMLGYITPACKEVDTLEDFEIIEYELYKKGSKLLDYLKTNFPVAN